MKFLFLFLFFLSRTALAGMEQISEKEFKDLAQELSGKVNLFQEAWKSAPEAEFYGGTTRDYLYWLKGQFLNAQTRSQAEAVITHLKASPVIDVREFIIGDSDVDVISADRGALKAEEFGVRKIDFQPRDILDPSTELGKNEILQGYIPAEKIRLAKDGFHATGLGDGISEIYHGKLSVHFASAEDFAKSKYAQEGINHPILLSLRYLRLQAINYYRSYGKGFPDPEKLHSALDATSAKAVKDLIDRVVKSGELAPYLEKNKFKSWINGGIQKSFRSYTNPTAALELMKEFGVTHLPERYPDQIETLNQYVFTKFRDPAMIRAEMKNYGVDESKIYTPLSKYFPDGRLYHGTQTEPSFRGILFQGILPSEYGSAGAGLYGVSEKNKEFSENWGGDKNRLLSFALDPHAKLIDITQGDGERLFEKFPASKDKIEAFADAFGADLLHYPYSTEAFVVKNGGVLSDGKGVYRSVMSLSALIEEAKKTHSVEKIMDLLSVNQVSEAERDLIWQSSPITVDQVVAFARGRGDFSNTEKLLSLPYWRSRDEVGALLAEWLKSGSQEPMSTAKRIFVLEKLPSPGRLALLDETLHGIDNPNSIHGEIYHNYLKKWPQPLTVEKTLSIWENFLSIPATARDAITHYPYIDYLNSAPLNASQQERAYKLIPQLLKDRYADGARALLHSLALNNFRLGEIKAIALDQLSKNGITEEHKWSVLLHEQFPADDEVKNGIFAYFTKHLSEFAQGVRPNLVDVIPLVKDDPRLKEFLLSVVAKAKFDAKEKETALVALTTLDLTDHELAQLLGSIDYRNRSYAVYADKLATQYQGKIGPEGAEALVRSFVENWANGKPSLDVSKTLSLYPHQAELRGYLSKILSEIDFIPATEAEEKVLEKKFQGIFTMLGRSGIEETPAIYEELFAYLEKHLNGENRDWYLTTDVMEHLNLSDSALAHRVAKLISESKVNKTRNTTLAKVIKSLPQECSTAFSLLIPE